MTKREFAEAIANKVDGTVYEANKNNGVIKIGVSVGTGEIRPTVYIDEMFENFMSVEEASEKVKEMASGSSIEFDMSIMSDFDKAREYLSLRLYNRNTNNYDIAKSAEEYGFDDLVIVPVLDNVIPGGSIRIRKEHLKYFGVTEDELFAAAEANINPDKYEIKGMSEIMVEMMGEELARDMGIIPCTEEQMYVIVSQNRMFGAYGVIALRSKIEQMFPNGYIVLPSSVHEVIIVPNTEQMNEMGLDNMVGEVNDTQVSLEEQLSNKAYRFVA